MASNTHQGIFPLGRPGVLQNEATGSPRPSSVGSAHSSNMSTKVASKARHDICVGEELKIACDIALERFRLNPEQKIMEFPSSLSSTERAYIHRLCETLGLKHKSKGKGANRYLTISKKEGNQTTHVSGSFNLVRNTRHQIHSLLQRFPITSKERQDLQPRTEKLQYSEGVTKELMKTATGRLNNGVPQLPPPRGQCELSGFRETLPVFSLKEKIVHTVNDNKVVLVSGETGSGKSTQVPQMILDECHQQGKPCRIFCTQPRRISAITLAERVAAERAEKIGQTVGYQIRLESRVSPKTLLTFCTNGVLLRTLMGGEGALSTVTHIIVDEIHERDRFNDFLLITLREVLPKFQHLKLILMSAALNIKLFTGYFQECPVINVPGSLYEVKEYFLEDVLKWTKYTTKEMEKYKKQFPKVSSQQKELDDWCRKKPEILTKDSGVEDVTGSDISDGLEENKKTVEEVGEDKEDLEPWLIKEMDSLLSDAWLQGSEEVFHQIFHLIAHEHVSVDYTHSQTSVTPLMIASSRGFYSVAEQLLCLGANPSLRASNKWNALDWAKKFEQNTIVDLLEANMNISDAEYKESSALMVKSTISPEDQELLDIYHHCFDDEKVDIGLIYQLIQKIITTSQEGAILVFLPGYDEIVTLRDKILDDRKFAENSRYVLYTLHSAMQSGDQRKVFRVPPPGVRKIILSTNIAETSVTISDVGFVIDSGKVKEKTYDALSSISMLKANWVSKASATQRRGRAGRCQKGTCYHLFSKVRHESMPDFQEPEIRRYPLQELCLHTKLLAPVNMPIADFLEKAPEPPPYLVTRKAVQILKQMDALDPFEDLTELGHHLADLPVEPKYGKMVLYSIVLKCLDPVLTITCALAYRDPFVLPFMPYQKRLASVARRKFAAGTFSDHMALLRAFQVWQRARADGWERSFCEKNFLSSATMEIIVGMRAQLLGQLRASGFVRSRGNGDIRDLNTNSENWAVVKAALVAGGYPGLLRVNHARKQITTQKENKVRFHNSSVLSPSPTQVGNNTHAKAVQSLPSDWLIYEEMTKAQHLAQVRCCTLVSPVTVAVFAGPARLTQETIRDIENGTQGDGFADSSDSETEENEEGKRLTLTLDDWISFKIDSEGALLVLQLRQKWHSLFLRRMRSPSKPWSQTDEAVVRAIVSVLTNEEHALGLQQPAGVGQRPRPMSTDFGGMVSSGNHMSVPDFEYTDDPGMTDHKHTPPQKGRPFRVFTNSPRRRETNRMKPEDNLESLSVRSSSAPGSATNSANNSATNSLQGSTASSPCNSPKPGSPVKPQQGKEASTSDQTCRYFVMKCNSYRQLDASLQCNLWVTTILNEKRINKSLQEGSLVFLIFSVQGSGHFQGFARVTGESTPALDKPREFMAPGTGAPFPVVWGKRANLQFQQAHHLLNPWNENRKVQVSRDGQEIEPTVGEALIKLWDKLPHHQPRHMQQYSGRGDTSDMDPNQRDPCHGGHRSPQWNMHGQGRNVNRYRSQGFRPYGRSHNQWHMQGQGMSGPRHRGPRFTSTPISSGHSGGMQMNPHMAANFNQLYVSPMMSQGQMMSQGSPGGNMFSHGQSVSPGQNVSPVMILQRGATSGGQGQSVATPPPSGSPCTTTQESTGSKG